MRIRTIKPEFFRHEGLFDLEVETGFPIRVAFAGLWCAADREGRFRWRPRTLKTQIIPYDEVDFSRVLDALNTRGFVVKYASGGEDYGLIPTFKDHQVVNNREKQSILPPPPETPTVPANSTRDPRDEHATSTRHDLEQAEGKGREGKGKEEVPPLSPKGGNGDDGTPSPPNPFVLSPKEDQPKAKRTKKAPDQPNESKARATSMEEVVDFVLKEELPATDGEWFWHKMEGSGWKNGGKPVKDWKATIRSWNLSGYLPSRKAPSNGKPPAPDIRDPKQHPRNKWMVFGRADKEKACRKHIARAKEIGTVEKFLQIADYLREAECLDLLPLLEQETGFNLDDVQEGEKLDPWINAAEEEKTPC